MSATLVENLANFSIIAPELIVKQSCVVIEVWRCNQELLNT